MLCTCRYLKYMYSGPSLPWCSYTSLSGRCNGIDTLHLVRSSDVVFFLQNCSRLLWPSSTIVTLPDHHPEHVNVTPPPLFYNSECWLLRTSCLRLDTLIYEDLCWNVICFRRVLLRWDPSTREIYNDLDEQDFRPRLV